MQIKVVLRADAVGGAYDKVAVISGTSLLGTRLRECDGSFSADVQIYFYVDCSLCKVMLIALCVKCSMYGMTQLGDHNLQRL